MKKFKINDLIRDGDKIALTNLKKFIIDQNLDNIINYLKDLERTFYFEKEFFQKEILEPLIKHIRTRFSDRISNYFVELDPHIFNMESILDFFLTKDGAYYAFVDHNGANIINTWTGDKIRINDNDILDIL
ncbi:MAG: hypothetical protein ACFE9R_21250 [Candidatus Hermodarchaeota archaeon]